MNKIYAVNLTVDTKTTDIYDKVAVNKYPVIVICNDENELRNKLSSNTTKEWIKHNIRTQHIYDTAYFCIREIYKNNVNDIYWKVSQLISISY